MNKVADESQFQMKSLTFIVSIARLLLKSFWSSKQTEGVFTHPLLSQLNSNSVSFPPLVRFTCADVNMVMALGCGPKWPPLIGGDRSPVSGELQSGSFMVRKWSDLAPSQTPGARYKFELNAVHSGMQQSTADVQSTQTVTTRSKMLKVAQINPNVRSKNYALVQATAPSSYTDFVAPTSDTIWPSGLNLVTSWLKFL